MLASHQRSAAALTHGMAQDAASQAETCRAHLADINELLVASPDDASLLAARDQLSVSTTCRRRHAALLTRFVRRIEALKSLGATADGTQVGNSTLDDNHSAEAQLQRCRDQLEGIEALLAATPADASLCTLRDEL